ncbi:unnamed protein product [Orchesella dallaii]|uniref:Transmembrane protein n=1 Tax=Orchesella dallaii TaxID=48710 RepID=A0ABP1PZW4_9HEXA
MALDIFLCPCMSLQQGVKILAIIDAVLSTLGVVLYTLALIVLLADSEDLDLPTDEKTVGVFIIALAIFIAILQILLAFRLYYGGVNRDSRNCRIWLIISVVIITVIGICFIVNVSTRRFDEYYGAGSVIGLVYKIYEMLVVSSFIKQLGTEMTIGAY